MKQSYIVIRSENRNKSIFPEPNDFRITEGTTFFGESGIKYIQGESCQFFYNIPNINGYNNVMLINTATMSYPVTVAQGFYDYTGLATALQAALIALGIGAWTVTWNTTTYRYVITGPVPFNFLPYPPLRRDLSAVMGFAYNGNLTAGPVSSQGADLAYTRNIYITSNNLNRHKKCQDQSSSNFNNLLFVIPVYPSEEFIRSNSVNTNNSYLLDPRNIFYEPHNMKAITWAGENIGDIDIQVYDDQEQLLFNPWGNQFSWSFRISLLAIYS
jgi:hypothetical protein